MSSSMMQHQPLLNVPAIVPDSVFVCSVGRDALAIRMQTAAELWRADVHAELLYEESRSLEEQINAAVARGAHWVVVRKGRQTKVKVKNREKQSELEMRLDELARFFISSRPKGRRRC